MAPRQMKTVTFTGLKGRDGYPTYPGLIPKHKALEMFNVDGYRAGVARKRGGSTNIFSSTTGEAFTGTISALARWVPAASITAAELIGVDNAATPRRIFVVFSDLAIVLGPDFFLGHSQYGRCC